MTLRLITGLILISFAVILDTLVRLRLKDAGERGTFIRGGTLDYGRYLKICGDKRWSKWPVYLIPVFLLAGVAFIVLGLFQT